MLYTIPTILLPHEIVHTWQVKEQPMVPADPVALERLQQRHELEAYGVSGRYEAVRMQLTDRYQLDPEDEGDHHEIEMIRNLLATPGDPFDPNEDICIALKAGNRYDIFS